MRLKEVKSGFPSAKLDAKKAVLQKTKEYLQELEGKLLFDQKPKAIQLTFSIKVGT